MNTEGLKQAAKSMRLAILPVFSGMKQSGFYQSVRGDNDDLVEMAWRYRGVKRTQESVCSPLDAILTPRGFVAGKRDYMEATWSKTVVVAGTPCVAELTIIVWQPDVSVVIQVKSNPKKDISETPLPKLAKGPQRSVTLSKSKLIQLARKAGSTMYGTSNSGLIFEDKVRITPYQSYARETHGVYDTFDYGFNPKSGKGADIADEPMSPDHAIDGVVYLGGSEGVNLLTIPGTTVKLTP